MIQGEIYLLSCAVSSVFEYPIFIIFSPYSVHLKVYYVALTDQAMSKISFEALKRDGLKLGALVTNVERGTKNFEKLSEAYSSCVLSTSNEKSLRDYFLNFFRLYLYIIDDITVLFTGSIHRKYHLSQHGELYGREGSAGGGASALHSRGKEGSYFTSGEFSRCSIDGFNYEFRKAETKMGKYEEVS